MTIIAYDSKQELTKRGWCLSNDFVSHEILYADDTLLIDVRGSVLQEFMSCYREIEAEYGLSCNWDKSHSSYIVRTFSLDQSISFVSSWRSFIYLFDK